MDKLVMTGPIFVDQQKAFDIADHACLLSTLSMYAVINRVSLQWGAPGFSPWSIVVCHNMILCLKQCEIIL